MLLDEEDDDVITSAPLLADIIGKKHTGGVVSGGTGLAQAPPLPAAARAATNVGTPPPLPARAQNVTPAGARPPPLPPAVATPTPAPPLAAPASTKAPSQPPPAAPQAAPTSAKTPTPAPPAPAAPVPSTKVPTQPPPPAVAPLSAKVPTPPPPDDEDEGTEAPRKLSAVKAPTPAPEPPGPPVPSQRAKPPTDAPEQTPPSDVVPTAPRPALRRSPTIPPAPKLPTGALGKPVVPSAPRPPVAAEDAADDDPRKKLSDTLPSGITMAALMQAEADAAAVKAKAAIPPPPAGTKPLFEITKRPAPAAPRAPTPAPRPAVTPLKPPTVPAVGPSKLPPPPSTAPAAATPSRTKSSLPPPPVRDSIAPPADPVRISNVELRGVEPFAQLPEEVQRALVRTAIIEDLVPGEARTAFGAVLVVAGEATVCAVNLDVPVKLAPPRSFIATRGSLSTPVPLRIVGSSSGATISRWSVDAFNQALEPHPQAAQDCRSASDALQARVGLTLGALAEVDLTTREAMLERLEVRALEPEEIITEEDGPMPGLVFVVGGSVEILEGDPAVVVADVRPGDLLFPEALWAGAAAPLRARAAASGALLLVGERKLALDFAENVPVVGELLSR